MEEYTKVFAEIVIDILLWAFAVKMLSIGLPQVEIKVWPLVIFLIVFTGNIRKNNN